MSDNSRACLANGGVDLSDNTSVDGPGGVVLVIFRQHSSSFALILTAAVPERSPDELLEPVSDVCDAEYLGVSAPGGLEERVLWTALCSVERCLEGHVRCRLCQVTG